MTRFVNPFGQYFDDAGNPLISGQLRFLDSGTNTLADTFSDINLTTQNTNPLQLTASGRLPPCFLANKYYKVRLETSAGVLIEERDPVGGFGETGNFQPWNYERVYNKPETITYNYRFYKSVVDGNQGNTPDVSSQWAEIKYIEEYLAGVIYSADDIVQNLGIVYRSLQGTNTGNTPAASPNYWERIGSIPVYSTANTYAQYERAYVGSAVYVSQQNGNVNHNPVTDTAYMWWKPQSRIDLETNAQLIKFKIMSGGGTLTAEWVHSFTDSSTYTLPAANSVPAGTPVTLLKLDTYRASQPTIQRAGADTISYVGGSDTSYKMDVAYGYSRVLVSDGISVWRI